MAIQSMAQQAAAASAKILADQTAAAANVAETGVDNSTPTPAPQTPQEQTPEVQQTADTSQEEQSTSSFSEEKIFTHLSEKLNRPVKSYEDLIEERLVEKEVEKLVEKEIDDPYAKKWLEYKEATGRDFSDFMKSQRDVATIPSEQKVREYLRDVEYGGQITDQELNFLMKDRFQRDPEEHDADEVTRAEINYKAVSVKADRYFTEQTDKYRVPQPNIKSDAEQREDVASQKKAKDQAWKQGVEAGIESLNGKIGTEEYQHKLTDKAALIEKYSTPDSLTKQFLNKDGAMDFGRLVKIIESGLAVEDGSFTKGLSESVRNSVLEDQTRKLNNHNPQQTEHRSTETTEDKMSQTQRIIAAKLQRRRVH